MFSFGFLATVENPDISYVEKQTNVKTGLRVKVTGSCQAVELTNSK